jgi:hypothetical protein
MKASKLAKITSTKFSYFIKDCHSTTNFQVSILNAAGAEVISRCVE